MLLTFTAEVCGTVVLCIATGTLSTVTFGDGRYTVICTHQAVVRACCVTYIRNIWFKCYIFYNIFKMNSTRQLCNNTLSSVLEYAYFMNLSLQKLLSSFTSFPSFWVLEYGYFVNLSSQKLVSSFMLYPPLMHTEIWLFCELTNAETGIIVHVISIHAGCTGLGAIISNLTQTTAIGTA